MLRIHNVLQRFLVPAMMAFLPACAFAGSQVVWQIGKFDKSTLEYADWVSATAVGGGAQCGDRKHAFVPETKQGTGQAAFDLVYVIGKSQTADWPCFQAGSSNGLEGYRAHPYAIQFDLPSKPSGLYTLKVALLVKSPRVSRLEVSINGHRGLYFQHPVLDYNRGDDEGFYMPNYSADTINAELPTAIPPPGNQRVDIDRRGRSSRARRRHGFRDLLRCFGARTRCASASIRPMRLAIDAQPTIFMCGRMVAWTN